MVEREYVKPAIVDFGTLIGLTEALLIGGPEDGASKDSPQHHSLGLLP
jgi:hypothetical protein